MFRLFRRKMISVVKYFRRNHFQKKWFFQKYFPAFGSHEKIMEGENAIVVGIWQRPVAVAGFRQACLTESGRIPAILARSGRLLTMAGFRPVSAGIWSAGIRRRWPDVAGFQRCMDSDDRLLPDSDNQILNVRERTKSLISKNNLWFLRFSKIKKKFTVKLKIIFVDHYFCPY
jgi:hypothetical protein